VDVVGMSTWTFLEHTSGYRQTCVGWIRRRADSTLRAWMDGLSLTT